MKAKKIIAMALVCTAIAVSQVNATETVNVSIEELEQAELNRLMSGIVKGVASGSIDKYEVYFESDAYEKMLQYFGKNKLIQPNAYDNIVDRVSTSYSSSDDCVVLVNSKFIYEDVKLLYMFEFHVNSSGKIYGLNIWSY